MLKIGATLVSRLTNETFESFVSKSIFKPLSLSSTTYNVTWAEQSGRFSEGFVRAGESLTNEGTLVPQLSSIPTSGVISGAGGVVSSANDMVSQCSKYPWSRI